MSWAERKINELGDIVTGKTPSTKVPEYFGGEYPFVTPSDIDYGHYYVRITETTVTEQAKNKHKNQFIPKDAVLFTCIGNTMGKCAIASQECISNQQINSVVANDEHDPKFLYYLLHHNRNLVRGIGMGGGAATPIINKTTFGNIKLKVPTDKAEQEAISALLEKYDDLIENNKRRIELLEESARQLYKEWFVRFRFPGHEHVKIIGGVPEGWGKKKLKDLLTLNYGKALKADNRIPGDFPVYGSSGVVGSHNKALVKGPGIIVGRKGNVGAIHWSHLDFFPIDTVYFISAEESSYFIYYALLHIAFINTDVAVPGLNRDFAYSREVILPTDILREEFEDEVAPIFKQCHTLEKYNDQLTKARDLLLPKLMNGEITV